MPQESPTAPAVLGVEEAAAALQGTVSSSAEGGLLSEDVANEILEAAQKAMDEYFKGKTEEALKHLAEAQTAIQVGVLDGSIANEQTGTSLALAVEALEAAILANPLPQDPVDEEDGEEDGEEEDGEDSGPGNSENAPGQKKKEEDDD